MAKNSKEKNIQRDVTKRTSKSKSSSDQKENRPKKVNKPNPNDSIPMSKQLLMKKQNNRPKRQSKNKNRICGNKKIMPSLADLEKMFEDTDDDSDENSTKTTAEGTATPLPPTTDVIDIDTLFSPTTRSKITEQAKEILLNNSDSNIYQDESRDQPPKKRIKLEANDSEKDEENKLPFLTTANVDPLITTDCIDDTQINIAEHLEIGENNEQLQMVTAENDKHVLLENINISDNSSDSHNTIVYKLTPPTLQNESSSQVFSPLPSTSTDSKTFIKNDELFNKSLFSLANSNLRANETLPCSEINTETTDTEVNNNQLDNIFKIEAPTSNNIILNSDSTTTNVTIYKPPENIDNDLQVIENPIETILIDDEVKIEPPLNNNPLTDVIKYEQVPHKNNLIDQLTVDVDAEDDDCIFVEAHSSTDINMTTRSDTNVIDLEYESLGPVINIDNYQTANMEDEVIDVDALIAQNESILKQFTQPESKQLDSTNVVVDVDMSAITENSNNYNNLCNNQYTPDILPEDLSGVNAQSLTSEEPLNLSNTVTSNSSNNEIVNSQARESVLTPGRIITPYTESLNLSESDRNIIASQVDNFFKNWCPLNLDDFPFVGTHTGMVNLITSSSSLRTSEQRQSSTPSTQRDSNIPSIEINMALPSTSAVRQATNLQPSSSQNILNKRRPKKKNKTPRKTNIVTPQEKGTSSGNLGDCPICMEPLSGNVIASTVCGHVFCMWCLQQAITANKRCPTCRKILNKKNGYHQIFL